MCKCKIGIRKNLYYPLMLIVFILLHKADEIIMSYICDYENIRSIIPSIKLISHFFAGIIGVYINSYSESELNFNFHIIFI